MNQKNKQPAQERLLKLKRSLNSSESLDKKPYKRSKTCKQSGGTCGPSNTQKSSPTSKKVNQDTNLKQPSQNRLLKFKHHSKFLELRNEAIDKKCKNVEQYPSNSQKCLPASNKGLRKNVSTVIEKDMFKSSKKFNSTSVPSSISLRVSGEDTMEWEPAKEEILRCARNETDGPQETMDWEEIISEHSNKVEGNENVIEEKTVYFVVDTNVLIQNLPIVETLISISDLEGFSCMVMIPWQVLKELDKLKSTADKYIGHCARKAIHFLSNNISDCNRIVFQSQSQHFKDCPLVLVEVPDDFLIKCCCQLKIHSKNVMLLSNDVNLCTKCQAIGEVPAVQSTWLSKLLFKKEKNTYSEHHIFEIEPQGKLNDCSIFMHKLTLCFRKFLYNIICETYKKKYGNLWPLWQPSITSPLKHIFSILNVLSFPKMFTENLKDLSTFFKKNNSYERLTAKEVENFGRKCFQISQKIINLFRDQCLQFDVDMGFMKTGNVKETTCGYESGCITLARNYFEMMEKKLKTFACYLDELSIKIESRGLEIPDVSVIIKKIDKHTVAANEASTIFLKMAGEEKEATEEELEIFHKALLSFLEVTQADLLPLFSPQDISIFIHHNRKELYPAVIEWLSELRLKFCQFKMFLRKNH